MGKFSKIWNRSKDGANHEERSFVRYVIISTAIFLLFICVIKRDNLFRWIEAGFNIRSQEKQMVKSLTTDKDTLEKFAREKFLFAEPGEDVYIIE